MSHFLFNKFFNCWHQILDIFISQITHKLILISSLWFQMHEICNNFHVSTGKWRENSFDFSCVRDEIEKTTKHINLSQQKWWEGSKNTEKLWICREKREIVIHLNYWIIAISKATNKSALLPMNVHFSGLRFCFFDFYQPKNSSSSSCS